MDKVCIYLTDGRQIKLELYPEYAPVSVENFLRLVDSNYYNGLCFHRVIAGFMIQGGGMEAVGGTLKQKGGLKPIKGEFKANGVNNPLRHELGVLSMARTNDPNSATSQFFICVANCPYLDGNYAAFGKTVDIDSNNVILDISKVKTASSGYHGDVPITPIVIERIARI